MTVDLEPLKKSIARVQTNTGRNGTAFYVGGRFALSALHVVAEISDREVKIDDSITLTFSVAQQPITARVPEGCWDVEADWVLLDFDVPAGIEPIEFGPPPPPGTVWITFGYPAIQPDGMTMEGTVSDPHAGGLARALQQRPQLQLFSQQAAAGQGAALHGFSGGPVLVNGRAAGFLRRTLFEETYDGRMQPVLHTQAGTVYATSSQNLIEYQATRRVSLLPGSWAPPELCLQDFIVLLSECERERGSPSDPNGLSLRHVALQAHRRLKNTGLGDPYLLFAADVVSSEAKFEECAAALCRAKVVVLDASDFEPAPMLLTGVRALARRGVTILSVGGNYALGQDLDVPFNLKNANIVAHSRLQNDSPQWDSVTLLVDRIKRGLEAINSPHYQDMPVFDAIRSLPPHRRGLIPSSEGVLVLCEFGQADANRWEGCLKKAFMHELRGLRDIEASAAPPSLGVARIVDLNSPQLITQAVFEMIRRAQSCVIDLTGWSASVAVECGVRIAASPNWTSCIIAKGWEDTVSPRIKAQCQAIAKLLLSADFIYDPQKPWEGQRVFSNAYGVDAVRPASKLLNGEMHSLIERSLDIDAEPASRPVYLDLIDQAELFSRPPGAGGRSKPVGLFPGNPELVLCEELADFDRLRAAWLYIFHTYDPAQILADDRLRDATERTIVALLERHEGRLKDTERQQMMELWTAINARRAKRE